MRKRTFRPKGVLTRVPVPYTKKVHYFQEMCQITSLSAGTGNSSGVMTFKLTDLQNIASFQTLFDMYKITAVKVKIVPRWNVSEYAGQNASSQAGNLPVLYIAENRDPYVPAPTTIGDILNDDGCKVIRLTKPVNLYLSSPKADLRTDSQTNALMPFQFGVGSKWQPWLTTGGNSQIINQSGLDHYGFRWLINNPSPLECVLDTYATLYFACKEQD